MVGGTYEANTEKEILCFKIIPENIFSCEYPSDFKPSENHYIESIEPLEVNQGVGLQIFGPPTLILNAQSFTISDRGIIKSIFKPWLNPKHISLQVPMNEIPKPIFWKDKFKELGYDIIFRYYSGESKPLHEIPYPNYIGYFFQLESRLNINKEGILINYCSIKNNELYMSFQQNDNALDLLWAALMTILADLPGIKISCGNCKFTGDEWKYTFTINLLTT